VDVIESPIQQEQAISILVIDDQQLFIDGLIYVLNNLVGQVAVDCANSIDEAMAKLAKSANYDIILLDMNMPGMGGLDFLQQINVDELLIPIVLISAEQENDSIQQALELGAMGFIPKSHNAEQIVAAIETVLEGNLYIPDGDQKLFKVTSH